MVQAQRPVKHFLQAGRGGEGQRQGAGSVRSVQYLDTLAVTIDSQMLITKNKKQKQNKTTTVEQQGQDTPASEAVLSNQVWLQMDQQFRKYGKNSHTLII